MTHGDYKYDYLFVGTGNSALVAASLLANAGYRVCMLEAHDIPGGYAQSFKWGDFYFCGQVHYIWGCGPGDTINQFLKKIGLEEKLTFEPFDPDCYDLMGMPDGKRVKIPYGFDNLVKNIEEAYPGEGLKVEKLVRLMEKVRKEVRYLPEGKFKWYHYITRGFRFLTTVRYLNKTLQDVFDKFGLSKESQAVICAQAGDFMSPPNELAFLAFVALFAGYNGGAYYPTKHFKYYIDSLADFITSHKGCHIFYSHKVTAINVDEKEGVTSVETENGRTFTAKNYVCNMDPQAASHLIGREKFPDNYLPALSYKYSPSGVMVYLGLKDANLKKHGLGGFNIWHLEQWDMNKMWQEQGRGDFSNPWVFISTATLHTDSPGVTPTDGDYDIMEIATYTEYKELKDLKDKDYEEYEKKKNEIAERLIDIVEKHYIPDLRKSIVTKVVGSPSSNEDWVFAPDGNAYGSLLTPKQIGLGRLKFDSPWQNLYWCNASSGFAGMHGTTGTGMGLYMQLTGDKFFTALPPDEVRVENAILAGRKKYAR